MRNRNFLINFFLAVILVAILYKIWPFPFEVFARSVILPISYKIENIVKETLSPFQLIAGINDLEKENKRLREENQNLSAQIATVQEKSQICLELKNEASASSVLGKYLIPAIIIGRTPEEFNRSVIVDKGSNDGVRQGDAVVSTGYLIGKIESVSANQSKIFLITNHSSFVPAVLSSSRETGLVQGGLEGLTLTDVPINSKIAEGENVLTSGLGGDLPAGIPIGRILKIEKSGSLFQTAAIEYPIYISKVKMVSIIK